VSKEVIDFINKHGKDVIRSVKDTGIFPSVKMAQMIIESSGKDEKGKFGIGKGLAVRKARNYFGIKADKSWQGKKVQLSTPKDGTPVSLFRAYNTPLDSLRDHTRFLLKNSRYKTNGVFMAKTPEQQVQALQKSGYSESSTYGSTLLGLINAYKLKTLDRSTGKSSVSYWIAGATVLAGLAWYYRDDIKNQFNQTRLTA
jgi:flagellum-specific peptidoglycan hydrolase FlgJ